jgi:regulator of replication initiation timing
MLSEADCFRSLDLAQEMIIQFLNFAEAHFSEEQLLDVGGRLQDVYQQTKDHEKRMCGKTFNPLKRLVRMEVFTEEQAQAGHEDLRSEYVELYSDFFAVCVERFGHGSENKDDFLQSVEMFSSELKRKW